MKLTCTIVTPLGAMIAASDGNALCGLWFAGQKHLPADHDTWGVADIPLFAALRKQLAGYFAGTHRVFDLPLAPYGTPFQLQVWLLLRDIPWGAIATYGALAQQLAARHGCRTSPRAVGGAVGRNPLSIIVPCHRVIGSDGGLTGYAGGTERKAALLALERGELSCQAPP